MVRTRFAPSPTGYMHIGNLRTALYTYLIAKSNDGNFILRIEDTDQGRYVEGAVEVIYNTLKMVGLKHDEGPDVGGEYGPYIQSQRKDIYLDYAKKLVEVGAAYYCFCTKERLDKIKEEGSSFAYDGYCRNISIEEAQKRIDSGEEYVIRQKIPKEGTTTFDDMVFGRITVENSTLDDNVLIKSDGLPTYNFANVIDDNLMKITHVIRGSEYLSSTPKYVLLYNAFNWATPKCIHLPLIMKEGGKKLSKREGDASFEDFYKKGYLPEAIINYIALLGWSPGDDREFFSLGDLEKEFSIKGLNKSPAVFDEKKLRWMNSEYIRNKSSEEFYELAVPYIKQIVKTEDIDLKYISNLIKNRTEVLSEIPNNLDFIDSLPEYDIDLYIHKRMKTKYKNSYDNLKESFGALEEIDDWNEESIHNTLFALVERLGVKNGQVLWPVRTALSGKRSTPGGAIELAVLLGKDESLKRLKIGMDKLLEATK